MSATYRARQFVQALGSWFQPANSGEEWARRYLPAEALNLYRAMGRYDRRHGLRVAHSLLEKGHNHPDLLAAALLHDAGKTVAQAGKLRLGHRVAIVLLRAVQPDLVARLGQDDRKGWRRAFFVQQHHADLGAELACRVGCSAQTVALIQSHKDPMHPEDDALLAALKAADNAN